MKILRGKTIAEKHSEALSRKANQKKPEKPLTAAQRSKIAQLKKRIAEESKARNIIKGAEIR